MSLQTFVAVRPSVCLSVACPIHLRGVAAVARGTHTHTHTRPVDQAGRPVSTVRARSSRMTRTTAQRRSTARLQSEIERDAKTVNLARAAAALPWLRLSSLCLL